MENDDLLIGKINNGDNEAWRILVDRHTPAIFNQAWRMLNDHAEAEDVTQETFVRFIKKVPNWRSGEAQLRTWLFRVAINLCIDRLRTHRAVPLDISGDIEDQKTGAAVTDLGIDLRNTVQAALAALPTRQRTAIIMAHYQGFSHAECAAVLNVSIDAVESLIARAKRTLKYKLANQAKEIFGETK